MKKNDMIKRWVAFYFSAILFFVLLPIVLSYSLGYKIDYHQLKIYKTGIISLKSEPAGAQIYINERLFTQLTPARIEELKPGTYNIRIKKEGFYVWQQDVIVSPNMVTKAEEILLFPLLKEINRVSPIAVTGFAVSDRGVIYYMTHKGLFRSTQDSGIAKMLSGYSDWPAGIKKITFSPDGAKMLFVADRDIWVIYMKQNGVPFEESESAKVEKVFSADDQIADAFWYSQSNHIVFVTKREINIVEADARHQKNVVTLYRFNSDAQGLFYDVGADSLYFTDTSDSREVSGNRYVYKLELRQSLLDKILQRFKKESL